MAYKDDNGIWPDQTINLFIDLDNKNYSYDVFNEIDSLLLKLGVEEKDSKKSGKYLTREYEIGDMEQSIFEDLDKKLKPKFPKLKGVFSGRDTSENWYFSS